MMTASTKNDSRFKDRAIVFIIIIMIIPVRCFTCGKVLADKYEYFCKESKRMEEEAKATDADKDKPPAASAAASEESSLRNFQKVHKGELLNSLGLTRYCCRNVMLSHVDMIEFI
jgi:DNA-directed RNA polymerase subunit N (RpoN/RPB10)